MAGSEEFNGKHIGYLQGAAAALLVCDLTRAGTLPTLSKYADTMRQVTPAARFVVVANKNDLEDQFELTQEAVASFADEIHAPCFSTSAKTGNHVEAAFTELAIEIEKMY